ncbi:MAG: cation transporter [Clostridia bacterium]|nr:cation transporter [Clostridia bacterium]
MIRFLVKRWIPDFQNTGNPQVRERYGVLGGTLGIFCNTVLFVLKLIAGIFTGSIAVLSDAFNNLSDMGASVVSVLGAKMGGRNADEDHPYGHGRAEYIAALIVAFLILFVGQELFLNAIRKMVNPSPVSVSPLALALLAVSLLGKLWMWRYNRYLGRAIGSEVLLAAARDSLNDILATGAVLASALLSPIAPFPLDGIMGLLVSCLILWSGYKIAKDTIHQLLGHRPTEELEAEILRRVTECDKVLGIHDLMVHDYGPGRIIASVHAEVPSSLNLVECHSLIDAIEKKILAELNVDIVIHMDPVT